MQLRGLADIYLRFRWLLALLVVGVTACAVVGVSRLSFDDSPLNIFRTEKADFALLQDVFDDFGSDDRECVVVVESPRLFTPEGIAALRRLIAEFKAQPVVDAVRSMDDVVLVRPGELLPTSLLPRPDAPQADYERARGEALAHPMLAGQVLADDGQTTLLLVSLKGQSLTVREVQQGIAAVRGAIERAQIPAELAQVRLTGVPSIRYEIFASIRRDSKLFVAIGVTISFAMATALFRKLWPVMIVAAPPILASFWTMGLLGLLGIQVNVINTVLPTMVMIVGFTDSMHLMVDILHSVRGGSSNRDAARLAIEHLLPACALTSFTTAVGFGSLAIAGAEVIRNFGLVCAAGSVMAFGAVLSLVPLLASIAPAGALSRGPDYEKSDLITHGGLIVIRWVTAHAKPVAALGIALTALLGLISTWLVPSNKLTESIPKWSESYQALVHCDRTLGGTLRAFVLVRWNDKLSLASPEVLRAFDDVDRLLRQDPGVHYPLSIRNVLEALPGPEGDLAARVPLLKSVPQDIRQQYLREDLHEALMTVHLQDLGSSRHEATFRRLEDKLAKLQRAHPGVELQLTGTVVVASRNINQMIADLTNSPGLAALVIFGLMTALFRSWRLGLVSILPNVFPMFATATMLVAARQPLQLTSVITFTICLGIAVDDTIHFVNRFQRELAVDGDVRAAIERAFMAVGTAIAMTTIVLLTGFLSVCLSDMPTSRLFGTLGCLAISSAVIGDLIILPALLTCFARRPQHVAPPTPEAVAAEPPQRPAVSASGVS
ncbi:MAG: MMPL family transporter [Pirellulales bacterium]|nr:MMPL family transporter [Pirellulales bacterium]